VVTVVNHPLVLYRLSLMRDKRTPVSQFRRLTSQIGQLMAYEVFRDLPLTDLPIETPVAKMVAPTLSNHPVTLVSVLRAGDALLSGFLESMPNASVGHLGLARDHETLKPSQYLRSLPQQAARGLVVILDPMLATGGSAIHAVSAIKSLGSAEVRYVSLVAAPEGLQALDEAYPDISVFTASIDEGLNEKGYIVPGLGDAGDRMFGTL
jgi:uracil phosphoribosyltransferase